jgi:glycosyltransferase involved in cell wall biosynthesis
MEGNGKVIVVMPAYNAERTLEATVRDIPKDVVDEIILVDDRSSDGTAALARKLGLTVIEHEENRGYGGNQKTCYDAALARGAEIVIMIHPDYQYDSRLAGAIVTFLRHGICDVVLGNRIRTRRETLACGMPLYKYIANRILSFLENLLLGQNLGEWHTGYRAYGRKVLETIPYHRNSDRFVFDTQFLVQAVHFGFRIGDVPVPVRYMKEASSIAFWSSARYGLHTLWTIARYFAHRIRIFPSPLFRETEPPSNAKRP